MTWHELSQINGHFWFRFRFRFISIEAKITDSITLHPARCHGIARAREHEYRQPVEICILCGSIIANLMLLVTLIARQDLSDVQRRLRCTGDMVSLRRTYDDGVAPASYSITRNSSSSISSNCISHCRVMDGHTIGPSLSASYDCNDWINTFLLMLPVQAGTVVMRSIAASKYRSILKSKSNDTFTKRVVS